MTAPLPPAAYPVGVFPYYTQHQTPVVLKLREKKRAFSGDDFDIEDATTGASVFHVNGKAWTMRGRKEIFDHTGTPLMQLMRRRFRWHTTFNGRGPMTNEQLFTVESSYSLGTKLKISYINTSKGRPEQLHLKGDFFDRKAEITLGGIPVARISRKFMNAGEVIFDQQTYYLTVASGVDAALLAAVCICLDEKVNERKSG